MDGIFYSGTTLKYEWQDQCPIDDGATNWNSCGLDHDELKPIAEFLVINITMIMDHSGLHCTNFIEQKLSNLANHSLTNIVIKNQPFY